MWRRNQKQIDKKYVVLTNQHLYIENDLREIEKKTGLKLEESEMKRIDNNYIIQLDDNDIDFVIDRKRMSSIPWNNLTKKDNSIKFMMYGMLFLQVITLLKG